MRSIRLGFAGLALLLIVMLLPAQAADDFASLAAAINAANSSGSGAITLSANITLTGALPAITGDMRIDGAGHSISGDDQYRVFVVSGGKLSISDLIVSGGRAPEDQGGGAILLRDGGELHAQRASFQRNRAKHGGAILAMGGRLVISDSRFERNCSLIATFSLQRDAEDRDLHRTGSDGCDYVNYRRQEPDSAVQANVDGGAIRLMSNASASIDASVFTENKSTYGGAISTASPGVRLNIERSSFLFNHASYSGGAISAVWMGGGSTVVKSSSFVSNRADDGGGGAIDAMKNQLEIANSTFSQNTAQSGGGLSIGREALVTITHATFVDNTASGGAQAISQLEGQARMRNSLISGRGRGEDCVGVWDQNIGNLSLDGSCADRPSDDARLGAITGSPAYYPLLDRSPAIDYADAEYCLERDQRGSPRNQGGGCDIGAIEAQSAIAAAPTRVPPLVCTLAFQIIAANRDQAASGCPAGSGVDTIVIDKDIKLYEALPAITSHIVIEGNGHSIDGDRRYRIFDVDGGRLTVRNLTMKHGRGSTEYGGAIRLLNDGRADVQASRFIDNQANYGGALFIGWTGTRNSWISVWGSQFIENGGSAIYAGGGRVSVSDSSFVGNWGGAGAGIGMVNPTRLEVSNSSFIGNTGSAIGLDNGVNATLTHITVHGAGLLSDRDGTAARRTNISQVRLRNSVLTGSYIQLCTSLTQNINNFIADGSCQPMLSGDPMLEAPTDESLQLSPLPGSPLIRAGHPSYCPDTDQTGLARAISGRCDIGAIESTPVTSALSDCRVTPTHVLNLRDEPKGGIIGGVGQGIRLKALARTPGWFQIEQDGATGWISADYVRTEGDCD